VIETNKLIYTFNNFDIHIARHFAAKSQHESTIPVFNDINIDFRHFCNFTTTKPNDTRLDYTVIMMITSDFLHANKSLRNYSAFHYSLKPRVSYDSTWPTKRPNIGPHHTGRRVQVYFHNTAASASAAAATTLRV